MIYMLFDAPGDAQKMAFLNDYDTVAIQQVYPPQKCDTVKKMMVACKDILKRSAENDTIVCWYDFMAVLCFWLCRIYRKKRRIIALNLLLKDKPTLKNKLARWLYKAMLKSDWVQATVTSGKYGEYLNQQLGIHREYTLLHDVYCDRYSVDYQGKVSPNTVFCGGRNGRDWDFLIKIAQALPEVIFNCVMPKDIYEHLKDRCSSNMMLNTEIPEADFLQLMCRSKLVVMPLDTKAPAGLIVFFQATANEKMSIVSDTVTTQEYFANGRGALCGDSVEEWKEKILYFLAHGDEADDCARRCKNFLANECSEKAFAEGLWRMLKASAT